MPRFLQSMVADAYVIMVRTFHLPAAGHITENPDILSIPRRPIVNKHIFISGTISYILLCHLSSEKYFT